KEAGGSARADWDSLGQTSDNLLDNANRFAPPGTPISVRVSQEDPGQVTIRVLDHGHGVPAAMRDRLFNRFVKGPAADGDGSGLGLAITRGLVEAHAGSIALADAQPGETTFRFTIPKADSRSVSRSGPVAPAAGCARRCPRASGSAWTSCATAANGGAGR